MTWRAFNWGSRGPTYDAGGGVYVATILIPHCVQVNLRGSDEEGDELLHIFDVISPNVLPTLSDCFLINASVQAWINGSFKPFVRSVDNILEVIATSRAEINGPQSTLSVGLTGGRSPGGTPLPSGTTFAVKKSGVRAGRSYRGRFYMWPMWSIDLEPLDGNRVTSTYLTLAVTTFEALRSQLVTNSFTLGVASNVLATISPVASIDAVDYRVDSQRRRLSGRGA